MAAVHRRRRGHRLRARGDPTWNHGTDSHPVMHRGRAGRMGAGHGRDDEGGGVHSCSNVGMGLVRRGGHRCAGSHTLWIVMGLCRSRTAGERGGIARVSFSETGSRAVIRAVLLHRATHGRLTRIFACATAACIGLLVHRDRAAVARREKAAILCGPFGRTTKGEAPDAFSMSLHAPTRNPRRCRDSGSRMPRTSCRGRFSSRWTTPIAVAQRGSHRGPGSSFRTSPTSRRQSSTMRFTAA